MKYIVSCLMIIGCALIFCGCDDKNEKFLNQNEDSYSIKEALHDFEEVLSNEGYKNCKNVDTYTFVTVDNLLKITVDVSEVTAKSECKAKVYYENISNEYIGISASGFYCGYLSLEECVGDPLAWSEFSLIDRGFSGVFAPGEIKTDYKIITSPISSGEEYIEYICNEISISILPDYIDVSSGDEDLIESAFKEHEREIYFTNVSFYIVNTTIIDSDK